MRDGSIKAEICTGGHQHQIVGAWRYGGHECESTEGGYQINSHAGNYTDFEVNFVAFSRSMSDILQYMSEIDQKSDEILRELSRNGRITNLELSEKVGLSPSACLRRVQDLEKLGVIKGYRAVLDPSALGRSFTAYVGVGLSDHSKASQDAFETSISRAPEVIECHNTTGNIEYLLRVEVSDLAAYKHFHAEVLGTQPQVSSITSYIIMGSPKDERA